MAELNRSHDTDDARDADDGHRASNVSGVHGAHRTRIKLCGMTRAADVDLAVRLGADAIGLVFYEKSPRAVSVTQAAALARRLPPFVATVGLFVNADAASVCRAAEAGQLSLLQFHGDETPAQCARLADAARLPWIRALRIGSTTTPADLLKYVSLYAAARGLVLDALVDGYGGGGHPFDWSCIPKELGHQVVLGGGLDARNVADAVRRVRPYAVDVSSGIEAAGDAQVKGVKDAARMAAFVQAVRAADRDAA
ncbi:phosphoribosylanthranilate isomerase [Robbsia sp. Bb-Pol-6]|uniref:N-(5'-phosphoribosyl)anthranilate isomerase n=1 Tax=Robbsia betulipollinis TaxID=2981849 RepID=A0ABT3ZIV3_9BURK|nr:phosphoribosylanthranilate isomerase [Robbsia betulipollinis]MCY0386454.1 phosphoribosylanthranilate isomerase [Robbsia betulipollinis]